MIDFKIVSDTEDEIEMEITQPNDLMGGTEFWTDEDWQKWNTKMAELDKNGTRGEMETIRFKLKKNPFIDGSGFITPTTGENSETGIKKELGFGFINYRDETSGLEVQPE